MIWLRKYMFMEEAINEGRDHLENLSVNGKVF
jgi:hypothetical protein